MVENIERRTSLRLDIVMTLSSFDQRSCLSVQYDLLEHLVPDWLVVFIKISLTKNKLIL